MAFLVPGQFRAIGDPGDPVGSGQFAPGHSIGGADAVDDFDESEAILLNGTWSYIVAAREIVAQYVSQGTTTYPSWVFATTNAAYTDACTLVIDLSAGREGLEAFVDFGHDVGGAALADVLVTIRRRSTAAILASGSVTTNAPRGTASIALAGITDPAAYAEIQVRAVGGGTATLYGIQLYSDEATP